MHCVEIDFLHRDKRFFARYLILFFVCFEIDYSRRILFAILFICVCFNYSHEFT